MTARQPEPPVYSGPPETRRPGELFRPPAPTPAPWPVQLSWPPPPLPRRAVGPPPPLPARPPGVVRAAVGAGALLAARVCWVAAAAVALGSGQAGDTGDGFFDALQRSLGQVLVAVGVLLGLLALGLALATALAWTGRTRVPLLVLGCVVAVLELLAVTSTLALPAGAHLVLAASPLAVLLGVTVVVLLALPPSAAFDAVHAAHRDLRRTHRPGTTTAPPTPNGRPAP